MSIALTPPKSEKNGATVRKEDLESAKLVLSTDHGTYTADLDQ